MERPFWIVFIESLIIYNLSILLYIVELIILKMSNIGLPPLCSGLSFLKRVIVMTQYFYIWNMWNSQTHSIAITVTKYTDTLDKYSICCRIYIWIKSDPKTVFVLFSGIFIRLEKFNTMKYSNW